MPIGTGAQTGHLIATTNTRANITLEAVICLTDGALAMAHVAADMSGVIHVVIAALVATAEVAAGAQHQGGLTVVAGVAIHTKTENTGDVYVVLNYNVTN